jgi:hypothetical protein
LVAWLGAVQAQEFGPAKWGLSLRLPETTTDANLDKAFDAGRILRTHVMRPTWHFVRASDIRWMLELTGPRVQRTISNYCRKFGFDSTLCSRATSIFERALDQQSLTRGELNAHLERAGMRAKGIALAMLTIFAELEGVICSGPRRGKNQTYAQLAARAPDAKRLRRDEALAELTSRFFQSHGPATMRDFVWWSGLTMADTKRGLEMTRAKPVAVDGLTYWTVGNTPRAGRDAANVHLLPIYDEYLVSYRDRDAVPHGPRVLKSRSRESVTFQHALVIAGQVAGTWRMTNAGDGIAISVFPLRSLTKLERGQINEAAGRYRQFIGTPVTVSISR